MEKIQFRFDAAGATMLEAYFPNIYHSNVFLTLRELVLAKRLEPFVDATLVLNAILIAFQTEEQMVSCVCVCLLLYPDSSRLTYVSTRCLLARLGGLRSGAKRTTSTMFGKCSRRC